MGRIKPFGWLKDVIGFDGVVPREVAVRMVVEAVASRYPGLTPARAAKEPTWTLDHVHDMALIERAMSERQQAAPDEDDY